MKLLYYHYFPIKIISKQCMLYVRVSLWGKFLSKQNSSSCSEGIDWPSVIWEILEGSSINYSATIKLHVFLHKICSKSIDLVSADRFETIQTLHRQDNQTIGETQNIVNLIKGNNKTVWKRTLKSEYGIFAQGNKYGVVSTNTT